LAQLVSSKKSSHKLVIFKLIDGISLLLTKKITLSQTPSHPWAPPEGSRVTILLASSVRMLVHFRPPDLKSSTKLSLPFAWNTGPATEPSLKNSLSYARHYKLRLVFLFTQFSLWLRLILQTIYVLKMELLHFLKLKISGL
jgi:hypothetical protein